MLIYLQAIDDPSDIPKFKAVYNHYGKLMFHIARRLLTDQQDVEDAVQEAFFALARNISKISDPYCNKTRAYVVITIERKALDILKARKRRPQAELSGELHGLAFLRPDGAVAAAIAKLPPRERSFLIMKYAEGYTNKELSEMLGLTYSGVNTLDHRAKQKLRELLKEEGIEV